MNDRGAWKIDVNGGFANFTEGDSYDVAAMDSLGDTHTRASGHDARAPKKPPSSVIGARTFMRSYAPISYTLGGVLPSGYLYGLTAKQGSGKTALMIAAALAVPPSVQYRRTVSATCRGTVPRAASWGSG